jgi:hypothetical protein
MVFYLLFLYSFVVIGCFTVPFALPFLPMSKVVVMFLPLEVLLISSYKPR